MLTLALTTIPPRFKRLGRVLESLLAQTIPVRVVLSVPHRYRRFVGEVSALDLPKGVTLNLIARDFGPASKLLGVLDAPGTDEVLYCDDDCVYAPEWAETLMNARDSESEAVAVSAFPVSRIKRHAKAPYDMIAQGFAGVLVRRDMFDHRVFEVPEAGYAADDIWLSGHLALRNIPIRKVPQARVLCTPLPEDGPSLQTDVVHGLSRAEANQACADALTDLFGLWPPIQSSGP